jgi:hypothetical protein
MFTDRAFRTARLWSNRELKQVAKVFTGEVVNVSAWDDRDKDGGRYRDYFTGATGYFTTNYSGERGLQQQPNEYFLDLTGEVPAELRQRFDVAFNHTTLEHVFEVRKAFRNLCELSRDVVIVIVPFAQVQHETSSFGDFWRFTPTCLRRLYEENGLTVIYEAENRDHNAATYLLFAGSRQPARWRDKLPTYVPLERSANWIGATPVRDAVVSLLTGKWHRLRKPPRREAA